MEILNLKKLMPVIFLGLAVLVSACKDEVAAPVVSNEVSGTSPIGSGSGSGCPSLPAPLAPKVTKVDGLSGDGKYNAGEVIKLTVTFDQIVSVTGTPRLKLASGVVPAYADYVSGDGSNVLQFNYTVGAGDATADLAYVDSSSLELNAGSIETNSLAANLELPNPGSADSLDVLRNYSIAKSDTFAKTAVSSQWTLLDKDPWDADGNTVANDDFSTSFVATAQGLSFIGRGSNVSGNTHNFLAAYLNDLTGNFDFTVKISLRTAGATTSRAGLFLANNAANFSAGGLFLCSLSGSQGIYLQYASSGAGNLNKLFKHGVSSVPMYLRVVKNGNSLACYYRTNPANPWTQHSNSPVTIASSAATFDFGIYSSATSTSSTQVVIFNDFQDLSL
jgi:hypothetical protein